MSSAAHMSLEEARRALESQVEQLRGRLEQLTRETRTLRKRYVKKCSKSLRDTLAGLLGLCESVDRADKQLVYWCEHGILRKLLLFLGIDKKANSILKRTLKDLKSQAVVVGSGVSSTGRVCNASLQDAQTLNCRVNEYRISKIGNAQEAAAELTATLNANEGQVTVQIREKEAERIKVNADIKDIRAGLKRTQIEKRQAEANRDSAAKVSAYSLGGAVALGFVSIACPPVGFFAGGAALLSGGSAVAACEMNGEARSLGRAHENMLGQLSDLESEIKELQDQIPALKTQQSYFNGINRSVATLTDECGKLRDGAKKLLVLLSEDRSHLAAAQVRMNRIVAGLRELKYPETRRQISKKLLKVFRILQKVGGSGAKKGNDVKTLSQARRVIRRIRKSTPDLLEILQEN